MFSAPLPDPPTLYASLYHQSAMCAFLHIRDLLRDCCSLSTTNEIKKKWIVSCRFFFLSTIGDVSAVAADADMFAATEGAAVALKFRISYGFERLECDTAADELRKQPSFCNYFLAWL